MADTETKDAVANVGEVSVVIPPKTGIPKTADVTEYSGLDERAKEEESKISALKMFTRRRMLVVLVVLMLVFAILMAVVAIVVAIQIQSSTANGAQPAMNTSITSGNWITQGGGLISRPDFSYLMLFVDSLAVVAAATNSGNIIWEQPIPGLNSKTSARMTVSNQGVIQVFDGDTLFWSLPNQYPDPNPNPVGIYTMQIVAINPAASDTGATGQLQILNSQSQIVWASPSS